MSVQVKAAVLIFLLVGSEGARVRSKVSLAKAQKRLESHFSSAGLGGNEVCREGDLSVDRYRLKMEKLKSLAKRLKDSMCGKSCPMKWLELKKRMVHFDSCATLLQDENVPDALREAITSGADALSAGMSEAAGAVSGLLEKHNFFPKFDDLAQCSFDPMRMDLLSAAKSSDPEETVRKQLFGQQCDDAASKQYLERLRGKARTMALRTIDQLKQVFGVKGNAGEAKDTEAKALVSEMSEQLDKDDQEEVELVGQGAVAQLEAAEEADDTASAGALIEMDADAFTEGRFWKIFWWIVGSLVVAMLLIFLIYWIVGLVALSSATASVNAAFASSGLNGFRFTASAR